MTNNIKPSNVIRFDKTTGQLEKPILLLKTRTGEFIDTIPYDNLQLSFVGKGLDEFSFDVHKIKDGKYALNKEFTRSDGTKYTSWDRLIDLAIIDYKGYGLFQAKVSTNDADETIKSVSCRSLEVELGQRTLYNFNVNNEEDVQYGEDKIPTHLYDENDEKHSLINRVLNEKAPNWSVGEVSEYFNVNGKVYSRNALQRTFSVDGTSVYDFFDGDICSEFNCIFTYDTYNRKVNCLNLDSCVFDTTNMEVIDGWSYRNACYYDENNNKYEQKEVSNYFHCDGIGYDTNIYVTKQKLANSFSKDSDDTVKNCFKVEGGDDIITNKVGAVNLSGNNYIYLFSQFQYDDMKQELRNAIESYQYYLKDQSEYFHKDGGIYVYNKDCTIDENGIVRDSNKKILTTAIVRNNKVYVHNDLAHYDTSALYYDSSTKEPTNIHIKYSGFGIPNKTPDENIAYYLNKTNGDVYKYNSGSWVKYQSTKMVDEFGTVINDYIYETDGGLFTQYMSLVNYHEFYEHGQFPNTTLQPTTAEIQKQNILNYFSENSVLLNSIWSDNAYTHVTSTIQKVAQVICDSRYQLDIKGNSCTIDDKSRIKTGVWKGQITLTREATNEEVTFEVTVNLRLCTDNQNDLSYLRQKMDIAIAGMNLLDIDFSDMDEEELFNLLMQYNKVQVDSFVNSFDSCRSSLDTFYANLNIDSEKINNIKKQSTAPTNPQDGAYWWCTAASNNYEKDFIYVYCAKENRWNVALTGRVSIVVRDMYTMRKNVADKVLIIKKGILDDCIEQENKVYNETIDFQKTCNIHNYFMEYGNKHGLDGEQLWTWFQSYIREDTYTNNNYISDGSTDSEILETTKELLRVAKAELEKACVIQYKISGDLNNIFSAPELEKLHDKFALYNYIYVNVDNEIYKLRLTEISFSDNNTGALNVTFSDQIKSIDGKIDDTSKILEQSASIATSYSYTTKQANQGASAMNMFDKMKQEGLDSSLYLLKSSVNEEQIFGSTGIWCKSMLDEGMYSDEMLRMVSNGMYLSDDGFNTVKTAIGKFKFGNEWVYGVNADVIVGEMIVGENLSISDKDGYVKIDGNGVHLSGGQIDWETPIEQSDIKDLTADLSKAKDDAASAAQDCANLNKAVADYLGLPNSTTLIGDEYVISPYIGTKYLYATGKIGNDNISVEINPSGVTANNITPSVFSIKKNNTRVIGLDSNGNAEFNGKITATSGSIGYGLHKWTIGGDSDNGWIYSGTDSMDSPISGTYIGTDGIYSYQSDNRYTKIKDGILSCCGADIRGSIYAIGGFYVEDNGTYGNCKIGFDNLGFDIDIQDNEDASIGSLLQIRKNYIGLNTCDFINMTSNSLDLKTNDLTSICHYATLTIDSLISRIDYLTLESIDMLLDVNTIFVKGNIELQNSLYTISPIRTENVVRATGAVSAGTSNTEAIGASNTANYGSQLAADGHITIRNSNYPYISFLKGNSENHARIIFNQDITSNVIYRLPDAGGTFTMVSSDKRLKTNIKPSIVNALETIDKLKTVSFDWKEMGYSRSTHWDIGLVVDDMEIIDPTFVQSGSNKPNDYKSPNLWYIECYLVKAIQELNLKNKVLEERIHFLETKSVI